MPGTFTYTKATNIVVVTNGTAGSPSDFASFVTADRAGSVTLLAAWAPNSNTKALTYQITPVEKLALLISFIVASKTAETDYIFITGTNAWDAAQTESIDVSAGNGTYTTTKRFRTITNVDCSDNAAGGGTVWADGTVAVTQPQWGVIWDKGNSQYQIDCKFTCGDGSTSTYFQDKSKQIVFKTGIVTGANQILWDCTANATIVLGQLDDAATYRTSLGCSVFDLETSNYHQMFTTGGTIHLYSSYFYGATYNGRFYLGTSGFGTVYIRNVFNCTFAAYVLFCAGANANIYNLITVGSYSGLRIYSATATMKNIFIQGLASGGYGAYCVVTGGIVRNMKGSTDTGYMFALYPTAGMNFYSIDDQVSPYSVLFFSSNTTMYRQYSCNIHITDKDGVNLASATILCEDTDGTVIFSVDTDANGNISEQIITYQSIVQGPVTTTYSPHKFTISKVGYETLVLDAITVSKPIVWHLELLPILAEADVRLATAFGENKTGTLDLPSINDVEKGIQFDGLTKTGTFKRPPQADVRLGEQYGANDIEFTGLLDLPAIADVRDAVFFDGLTKEGILDLPSVNDVEKGVQFDNLTKTGTFKAPAEADVRESEGYGANDIEFEGDLDLPDEEDVEEGVQYDGLTKTGRFHVPAEEDVEVGVGYGADGIEFEGTYLGLRGDNLTAELEKSVDLVGYLENKVELTGELKS